MWQKLLILAGFSLVLAGCERTVYKTVCPPIVTYDQPFQTKLAGELRDMPEDSALVIVTGDYYQLRQVIRACEAK